MVHALREAHRVLKPNSLLIDLRPAAIHRQVGIVRAGCYQLLGTMREKLGDDRAANRAVAQVVRAGLFKAEWRAQFECRRVMDSLGDLRTFIDEFYTLGADRSEEHTSELQSPTNLVCRLLLEKKKKPQLAMDRAQQTGSHTKNTDETQSN